MQRCRSVRSWCTSHWRFLARMCRPNYGLQRAADRLFRRVSTRSGQHRDATRAPWSRMVSKVRRRVKTKCGPAVAPNHHLCAHHAALRASRSAPSPYPDHPTPSGSVTCSRPLQSVAWVQLQTLLQLGTDYGRTFSSSQLPYFFICCSMSSGKIRAVSQAHQTGSAGRDALLLPLQPPLRSECSAAYAFLIAANRHRFGSHRSAKVPPNFSQTGSLRLRSQSPRVLANRLPIRPPSYSTAPMHLRWSSYSVRSSLVESSSTDTSSCSSRLPSASPANSRPLHGRCKCTKKRLSS